MSVDLTPYRGKRALVFGPFWAVEGIFYAFEVARISVVHEHDGHIALALLDSSNMAVIYGGATGSASVRAAAKAAGIPVLRVRRDGSIEGVAP